MGKYYSFWHSEPKLVLVFNCCNSADVNDVRLKHRINLLNQIYRAWQASWRKLFKQQEGKNVCWKICKGFLFWHLRIRKEPRNPICTFLVVLCILCPGTTERYHRKPNFSRLLTHSVPREINECFQSRTVACFLSHIHKISLEVNDDCIWIEEWIKSNLAPIASFDMTSYLMNKVEKELELFP